MGDERTTNIQVYAPNGLDNQKWGIYDAGDGSYFFVPKYSKKNVMDSSKSGEIGSIMEDKINDLSFQNIMINTRLH